MNGRLPALVMVFAALAMVISLVVALTPDASAQDSVTAPDVTAMWMRHNTPASQDLQAICCTNQLIGLVSKTCCITIVPGYPQPGPDAVIGSEPAAGFMPSGEVSRWFCAGPQD
jgi:hypothetical protein